MPRFGDPEPLRPDAVLEGFDCGRPSLNVWLIEHARVAAAAGSARTYVITDSRPARVVGYHALTAAGIERAAATARAIKGMPRYTVPVVLIARLAVDRSVWGHGSRPPSARRRVPSSVGERRRAVACCATGN